MGVWQSLLDVFHRPVNVYNLVTDSAILRVMNQSPADLYRSQPHLQTVVSFLARNTAQLGLQMFQRVSDTDRKRVTDDPLIALLQQPNPTMTQYELIEDLVGSLSLYDSAYWYVTPAADMPSGWGIRPIPAEWVTSTKDGSLFEPGAYVVAPPSGERVEIPAEDMLVFHGWNPGDPTLGTPPVAALKDVLAEQIDAWRFRRQVWERGGRVGTYISRPATAKKWGDDSRNRFVRDWKQFEGNGEKAGKSPILEDGMELKQVGFSAREQEWLDTAKLSLQTVASIYHVNPVMVGILDNANFSNTREFRKMLYSETLGPLLRMIQDRINTFLVPKVSQISGAYVEFNIAAKLAGDFEEQASVLSTLVGRPILSLDEGRAKLNYPAVPGGDAIITPLNVTEGGQASPQDGGDPSMVVQDTVKQWLERRQRTVDAVKGSGRSVDEARLERELQADLVAVGMDQFNAGLAARKASGMVKESS